MARQIAPFYPVIFHLFEASQNRNPRSHKSISLGRQFANQHADAVKWSRTNHKQEEEQLTIQALVAIIKRDRNQGMVYHQAIEELGKYRDNPAALRALVENINPLPSRAPSFTGSPIEHFRAAQILVKCGPRARRQILNSASRPQSERTLHIMAYVLVQLFKMKSTDPLDKLFARSTNK